MAQMLAWIRTIHDELKGATAAREWSGSCVDVGTRPARSGLMREHGIRARHKRRYNVTTDSKHNLPVAPSSSNQTWTLDMSYLWTDEGWLYLAIVLTCSTAKWWAVR
jgi:putative transposase